VLLGGNEGAGNYSIGVGVDVYQKYRFDLKYNGYYGNYATTTPGFKGYPGVLPNGVNAAISDRGGLCVLQVRIIRHMNDLSKDAVNWLAVGEDGAGQHVDNYLAKVLKGVPKSHVYRILRSGEVRVNRRRVGPDTRLQVGDQLRIPPMTERALPPVLVLISDGQPTDDFSGGLQALMNEPWGRKAVRVAIAIGEDADHEVLKQFIANPELEPLQANNPESLIKYIRWVSTAVLKSASSPASQSSHSTAAGLHVPIPAVPDAGPSSVDDVW